MVSQSSYDADWNVYAHLITLSLADFCQKGVIFYEQYHIERYLHDVSDKERTPDSSLDFDLPEPNLAAENRERFETLAYLCGMLILQEAGNPELTPLIDAAQAGMLRLAFGNSFQRETIQNEVPPLEAVNDLQIETSEGILTLDQVAAIIYESDIE